MARAATKQDLISAANEQFEKMWALIDAMTEEEKNAAFDFGDMTKQKEAHWQRDKNLRDVLVHLYEWHQLLLNWVKANQSGDKKPFLPRPYNWRTYGQMNVGFWKKHQNTTLDNAVEMLQESHSSVMHMIDGFSNDELFVKGSLTWTGTSTLGSYCVSSTASHYDWAIKKIKAHDKIFKGKV
ncbi:MAG: ClbS/DfsB family four-helix bundle protein [Lachnospiraceae bacterium]